MADDGKSFTWQTAIALGGLLVSVFGNWIQYQSLQDKKTELAQAQQKLDAALDEARQKKVACEGRRRDLETRLGSIDRKMQEAEMELRRAASALAFAPTDQKPLAMQIMRAAEATRAKLLEDRKSLQDKFDGLPTC